MLSIICSLKGLWTINTWKIGTITSSCMVIQFFFDYCIITDLNNELIWISKIFQVMKSYLVKKKLTSHEKLTIVIWFSISLFISIHLFQFIYLINWKFCERWKIEHWKFFNGCVNKQCEWNDVYEPISKGISIQCLKMFIYVCSTSVPCTWSFSLVPFFASFGDKRQKTVAKKQK